MKRSPLVGLLLLSSCSLLFDRLARNRCDGEASFCDGDVLVRCVQGVELIELCDAGRCDAANDVCAACGDGVTTNLTDEDPSGYFEGCDDGNLLDGDTCSAACTPAVCGDGLPEEGSFCFAPGEILPSPLLEPQLQLADMNNDGVLDVVGLNAQSVGVLPGNGDGTFSLPTFFPGGGFFFALGDLNQDGAQDVAVTSAEDFVLLFFGDGDGSLQTPQALATGPGMGPIKLADLNQDGALDIIASEFFGDIGPAPKLNLLLGNGDGSFASPIFLDLGGPIFDLAIGDLNGDSHLDIAAATTLFDGVRSLFGNGDGSFQAPRSAAISNVQHLTAADFNLDGRDDLVSANNVLLSQGDGSFTATQITFAPGLGVPGLGVADLDQDGRPDLLAHAGDDTFLFVGNGDGSFQSPRIIFSSTLGLLSGDLNNDGSLDLVGPFSVFDNSGAVRSGLQADLGNGDFSFQTPLQTVLNSRESAVLAVDLNQDGAPDLVSAQPEASLLSLRLGESFSVPRLLRVSGAPTKIFSADLNQDSSPDVVSLDPTTGLQIFHGDGVGGLSLAQQIALVGAQQIAIGDLRDDSKPELLVLANGAVQLLIQLNGSFSLASAPLVGDSPSEVLIQDLDQDGRAEILVRSEAAGEVRVLWNLGGAFSVPEVLLLTNLPTGIVAGDLNGDDLPELVISSIDTTLQVLSNEGERSFSPSSLVLPATPIGPLLLGDFDGRPGHEIAVSVTITEQGITSTQLIVLDASGGLSQLPAAVIGLQAIDMNHDSVDDLLGLGPALLLSNP